MYFSKIQLLWRTSYYIRHLDIKLYIYSYLVYFALDHDWYYSVLNAGSLMRLMRQVIIQKTNVASHI